MARSIPAGPGRLAAGLPGAEAALARRVKRAVFVAAVLSALATVSAAPVLAAPTMTGWTLLPTQNRPVPENQLAAASCTSPKACTAVGFSGPIASSGHRTLAERWNGQAWTIQKTANPKGAKESRLLGVSCWSAHGCVSVGTSAGATNVLRALAEWWNGTSWKLLAAKSPRGGSTTMLEGVSCTAANMCVAVGAHAGATSTVSVAERWNGTAWTAIPPVAPAHATFTEFRGVSCSSAKACTAVGDTNAGGSGARPLAERWNGKAWKIQPVPGSSAQLNGVSCPSATACTAVGIANPTTTPAVLAEHWNGNAWKTQAPIKPGGSTTSFLYSVSCVAATSCTAVGQSTGSVPEPTLAEGLNGAHWTIQPTPNPVGGTDSYLAGVSCLTANTCRAAGAFFSGATKSTLAEGD